MKNIKYIFEYILHLSYTLVSLNIPSRTVKTSRVQASYRKYS